MAEIKTLKQGETQVLPRTVAEAVNTDSGLSVQAELDALKESTPDVSAQINEHNVAEDAHANRFANYLPLSGGTMTGDLVIGNEKVEGAMYWNQISFSKNSNEFIRANENIIEIGQPSQSILIKTDGIVFNTPGTQISTVFYEPTRDDSLVTKKYVDTKIAAIPTPDVSAQIEAHNTSTAAHANMHWLTSSDEELSEVLPGEPIDADTLEGHPASYFATKTDLESIDLSDYVLKSELSTLVPAPDLSNYYTKTEVDAKITQIQQLIDEAAALVDEINGEVI